MLDVLIRFIAHVLTPLFLIGLAGSALVVLSKIGSDVVEFFADDEVAETVDSPHQKSAPSA